MSSRQQQQQHQPGVLDHMLRLLKAMKHMLYHDVHTVHYRCWVHADLASLEKEVTCAILSHAACKWVTIQDDYSEVLTQTHKLMPCTGGGSCAFLLLKMTKVLLISESRACLAPSPYLDAHGEEDLDLTRGR